MLAVCFDSSIAVFFLLLWFDSRSNLQLVVLVSSPELQQLGKLGTARENDLLRAVHTVALRRKAG